MQQCELLQVWSATQGHQDKMSHALRLWQLVLLPVSSMLCRLLVGSWVHS